MQNNLHPTQSQLINLLEHFDLLQSNNDKPTVEGLQVLADKLSDVAGREGQKRWRWRALHMILNHPLRPNGKPRAGQELQQAMSDLGALLDGTPPAITNTEQVTVFAKRDTVENHAVIIGKSKQCKNPTCAIRFVHAQRLYCSDQCSQQARNLRRRASR